MKRRDVLKAALASVPLAKLRWAGEAISQEISSRDGAERSTMRIAGMTLAKLADDYRDRLFRQYLPFWERGGCDENRGGFFCELNDDGSVAKDEKFIWYQGRGLWVYSFLHQSFGRRPEWLEVARKARDFMVRYMHAGVGRWHEKVRADGTLLAGAGPNIYGALFAALGLVEYYRCTGSQEDLDLAKLSLRAAVQAYNDAGYTDLATAGEARVELPARGVRIQGHSMMFVNVLSRLLDRHRDPQLETLQREHVDRIINRFWHPAYGISNEYLDHDYRRAPGCDTHMLVGHSIETLWLVMSEAVRTGDRALFDTAKGRVRRFVEMGWDYVFGGLGDEDFLVFGNSRQPRGPYLDVKTMWSQCEAMIGCMMIFERTGEAWAREWYERLRGFALKTMPVPSHGVWRQAVNRTGGDLKRAGYSTKRKDNYHQARYLMLNLLSVERMLASKRGDSSLWR